VVFFELCVPQAEHFTEYDDSPLLRHEKKKRKSIIANQTGRSRAFPHFGRKTVEKQCLQLPLETLSFICYNKIGLL